MKNIREISHEIKNGARFEFGKNWHRYANKLDESNVTSALSSLKLMLKIQDLSKKKFLDVGCGSGLFSLAARKLGAEVVSFDYDPDSSSCAQYVKNKFSPNDDLWKIMTGSVLDANFISQLGKFDVVYSWGVLHHTGNMWLAIDNASLLVKEKGFLFISIYNYQPYFSSYWLFIKKTYNKSPFVVKKLIEYIFSGFFMFSFFLADLAKKNNPLLRYKGRNRRGMQVYCDVVDWVGGWPFEVAKPEKIIDYLYNKNFSLIKLKTCGGRHGCNEYVFEKIS